MWTPFWSPPFSYTKPGSPASKIATGSRPLTTAFINHIVTKPYRYHIPVINERTRQ